MPAEAGDSNEQRKIVADHRYECLRSKFGMFEGTPLSAAPACILLRSPSNVSILGSGPSDIGVTTTPRSGIVMLNCYAELVAGADNVGRTFPGSSLAFVLGASTILSLFGKKTGGNERGRSEILGLNRLACRSATTPGHLQLLPDQSWDTVNHLAIPFETSPKTAQD